MDKYKEKRLFTTKCGGVKSTFAIGIREYEEPNGSFTDIVDFVSVSGPQPTVEDLYLALYEAKLNSYHRLGSTRPWRVATRKGMSGCIDYTLLMQHENGLKASFGLEQKVASIHLSMYGKVNNGYFSGPLVFLFSVLETNVDKKKLKKYYSLERSMFLPEPTEDKRL